MVFPNPYPTLLSADPTVDAALAKAVVETQAAFPAFGNPPRLALSIATVDPAFPGVLSHAGLQFGQTFYSASLLKVAAMYAAYELRATVHALGSGAASGPELFSMCRQVLDPDIASAVRSIDDAQIPLPMRVPSYERLFVTIPVADGGLSVEFSGEFQAALRAAIVDSNNAAAATCIKMLGYSWINGTLAAGGYFFPETQEGLWLAGTFMQDQPYVRINSVNDGPIAQGATTFDLANLYAHLLAGTLVDTASSAQMLALLFAGALGPDPSFLDGSRRPDIGSATLAVTHTKIGVGPLKAGGTVMSEGTLVNEPTTGRQFLVVFQNALGDADSLRAVTFLVERTIAGVVGTL